LRHAPVIFALLAAVGPLAACNDNAAARVVVHEPGRPSTGPDLPMMTDADASPDLPATASLCEPGARRCIAENSPLVESCEADGRSYTRDSCPAGTVCRDRRCAPFTCVANFPVCVGITTAATCAPDGRSVIDAQTCPDGQSCRGGACVDLCELAATERSYIGCDYIARELPNIYRDDVETRDHPFAIVVTNPHPLLPARVLLSRTDKLAGEPVGLIGQLTLKPSSGYQGVYPLTVRSELFSVTGNTPLTVEDSALLMPPSSAAALLIDPLKGGGAPIHITSDRPVVAYQYNPYCCNFTATNDASLLLPTATLGTRYRAVGYPSMTFGNFSAEGYLSIIAGAQPAHITMTHTSELRLSTALSSSMGEPTQGRAIAFTLKPYEEAIVIATDDVNGASIASDTPISVFAGHPCTNVPQDKYACDHLEDQLPPADTLGTRYLLPALRSRGDADNPEALDGVYWQIVADADAILRFDPPLASLTDDTLPPSYIGAKSCAKQEINGVINLAAGTSCEIGLLRTTAASIESDAPIIVAGVLSGHESTGKKFYGNQSGDPSLFILPAIEQTRTSYAFVNPPTYKKTFATVAIPAGEPLVLDGRQVADDQRIEPIALRLRGRDWEVFSVALSADAHTLSSDERFLLVVYAYDDYVSYAFPGGLDLIPRKKD
jgi:hypothetical protein